nr:MAG TPA: hypothetical protein [Caudoviricetes sp.]
MNWSVSAESFRSADASVLEKDAVGKKIIAALNRYIDNTWRQQHLDTPTGMLSLMRGLAGLET